jgi:type IV secretion system protein VirB2
MTHARLALALAALLPPSAARAQYAAADPAGSGPILGAIAWLQGTLLGNVATAVAVIAVAAIGFMMLTGRINWRYGGTVVVGLFILFGATTIVGGIRSIAGG